MRMEGGTQVEFWSLAAIGEACSSRVERLPMCLRIVLESLARNCDGVRVTEEDVRRLAAWQPTAARTTEVPFVVGRVVLQDVAGIPVLGDFAAMRAAAVREGVAPELVSPKVPVTLVVDHALTVEYHGSPEALEQNMRLELERNAERFTFLKWAVSAFGGIRLIPPGMGILHQLNMEWLGGCLLHSERAVYPDSLVGTDSHTGMIGALGVVGWGVGGIEAESAILGEPIYFLTPDVTAVHLTGSMSPGITATDVVLQLTRELRAAGVVGQFVEFIGEGVGRLSVPDRATIANMAPEYGATMGFFAFDVQTRRYLEGVGRARDDVDALETYLRLQGCYGAPDPETVAYTRVLGFDLSAVRPCLSGPRRPQDTVLLADVKASFESVLHAPTANGGYGRPTANAAGDRSEVGSTLRRMADGDVVIAAITSCTNTANPHSMLAAGLLAQRAAALGLQPKPWVKTSLAPGSIVVAKYLQVNGLQKALDELGFAIVGFGCATCVGNSGPLDPEIERKVVDDGIVACAVLSGNRNFEARIHPAVRATYLASPPLVVAFALAGTIAIDFEREPLGTSADGNPIYLRDLWPTPDQIARVMVQAEDPALYREAYSRPIAAPSAMWSLLRAKSGRVFEWDPSSTYIVEPPFFRNPELTGSNLRPLGGARALAILGDSVTTDHISPIGTIPPESAAGLHLRAHAVPVDRLNTYGARRMNHEVMARGTFANLRLRNTMVGREGGFTIHQPSGDMMTIFDAAARYATERTPLVVIAGKEYGMGSSRDWAAKGTRLLGVRAVIAGSFERIHRSNLVGMGVLPCELPEGVSARSLSLDGSERFSLPDLSESVQSRQQLSLMIERANGDRQIIPVTLRIDTAAEMRYVREGGLLLSMLASFRKAA